MFEKTLYLPVDGYNSWRNCKYFALTKGVSNYKEKKEQYFNELLRKDRQEKKEYYIWKNSTIEARTEKKCTNKEETRDIVSREKNTRWVRFVCGREISKRQEY